MPLPEPGRPAPDFSLPDQHGRTVRLADFVGQRVLVWFFSRAFGSN
jgi:peroxiredoxin Q/BCP